MTAGRTGGRAVAGRGDVAAVAPGVAAGAVAAVVAGAAVGAAAAGVVGAAGGAVLAPFGAVWEVFISLGIRY